MGAHGSGHINTANISFCTMDPVLASWIDGCLAFIDAAHTFQPKPVDEFLKSKGGEATRHPDCWTHSYNFSCLEIIVIFPSTGQRFWMDLRLFHSYRTAR